MYLQDFQQPVPELTALMVRNVSAGGMQSDFLQTNSCKVN